MEPSSKETRRTSSPIKELINSATHWEVGEKDSIINKEEMEFRRVSLFDVSKRRSKNYINIVLRHPGMRSVENEFTFDVSNLVCIR